MAKSHDKLKQQNVMKDDAKIITDLWQKKTIWSSDNNQASSNSKFVNFQDNVSSIENNRISRFAPKSEYNLPSASRSISQFNVLPSAQSSVKISQEHEKVIQRAKSEERKRQRQRKRAQVNFS